MELYAHNIDFEGFEVRFEYDKTKLQPSIISTSDPSKTNTIINLPDGTVDLSDLGKYFKFTGEFAGTGGNPPILEFEKDISEKNADNVIVAEMSFNLNDYDTYDDIPTSTHVIERDGSKAVKSTPVKNDQGEIIAPGEVKIGEISFRMLTEEPFALPDKENNIEGFHFGLVENFDRLSPVTGIKIQLNEEINYHQYHLDETKTFRFTDMTASKDAELTNILVSSGEVNTENPDESTYKEYDLTPEFNKEIKNYTITLMEYIDTINIKATQSDTKATMKIKVPKHDSDGNLVYESDGTTIVYEEKDITHEVPMGVTLNKLGDPDTKVTISITAEDGVTTNEYEVLIKRPYGIIKGSVYTAPTDSKGIFKSNVRVYKTSEVNKVIDKSQIVQGRPDDVHQKLLTLKSQDTKTNEDGTYEIYVIPGTYDILIDKPGYLDHIYESREVKEGQTLDLGLKEIFAGDTNKDGVVEITDLSTLLVSFGKADTDADYSESTNFNDDSYVEISDLSALLANYLAEREIK